MGAVSVTGPKTCLGCGEKLPPWYRGEYHKDCAGAVPDALDAELAVAESDFGKEPAPLPSFNGATLVPVDALPERSQAPMWRQDIVRAFLAGHKPVCRVDRPQNRFDSLRNELKRAVRELGVTGSVQVTVRQGACYLVKVGAEGGEPTKTSAA